MDDHVDLVRAHVKEPVRLDDLKAFVHERCRVNGDPAAHAPVGMRQRLLRRGRGHFGEGSLSKRAARGGQDEPLDLGVLAGAQTLMDRVVLAIDGKQFDIGLAGGGHHDFTRRDKDFFIRKRDLLSCFYGRIRGFEAHNADGGGNQRAAAG